MLINMIDLNGNTKQYYNAKKVYECTIPTKDDNYNVYLIYNDDGNLLGFGWKDEEPKALTLILSMVKSKDYAKVVPTTVEEYRRKHNEVRRLKVSKNKSNSYSLYLPATWAKEFLGDDMYVDVTYRGDSIIIKKPKNNQNEISE